jgi:hypothetical protein
LLCLEVKIRRHKPVDYCFYNAILTGVSDRTGNLIAVSTHKIDDLLNESHSRFTPLQRLLKTSSNQKQWTAEFRAFIDAPLKHEVGITDIRGPTAYALCRSAAAATRLRFLMPDLLPQLQTLASFKQVTALKVTVANSSS